MAIGIALSVVALVLIVFAASRVMARKRPTAVREEAPQLPSRRPHYVPRPHYEARRPRHYALPPVTIETLPIDFKRVPEMVPPIDPRVLAALVASGSRSAAEVARPEMLARGSVVAPAWGDASDLDDGASDLDTEISDADGAEASDLDDDALTRQNMSPVH